MSQPEPFTTPQRVLVVSDRPAVRSFFSSLPFEASVDLHARPDVILVDLGTDQRAAERRCAELRELHPNAALLAVVCCQQSIGFWQLQALLGTTLSGVIDLHSTPDEVRRAIASAARGESVVHLQLARGQRDFLRAALTRHDARSETNLRLLVLVAQGLPDHEIGRRLHLSPHTVKHYVEQLREELGVRNRIELASWAGRAGLYAAGDS